MALVNMDRWLAAHGVQHGMVDAADDRSSTPAPPPPLDPAIVDHIHALEATVERQAKLIVDLQAALRTELAKHAPPSSASVPHVKRGIVIRNRKGK